MKLLRPVLASLLFIALVLLFTPSIPTVPGTPNTLFSTMSRLFPYHLDPSLPHSFAILGHKITLSPESEYFISSPFNMETEGAPLYNLWLPAVLILMLGIYLKNFNKSFQKKCNLRAVFIIAIIASYIKSIGSMLYYRGYADFGISLGTSIITLCFIAAFLISLEVYIEQKEKYQHLYGSFMFALLTGLVLLLAVLTFFSFFASSSLVVHAMGLTAFLLIFIPFYERNNIAKFLVKEEKSLVSVRKSAA